MNERTSVQGLDLISLETPEGHRAQVSPWGGQVLSWCHAVHGEQLYCSPLWRAGQPLRGGVPVCFPQFASRGVLPKHGFARTSLWALAQLVQHDGRVQAHLCLQASDETRALWPHDFTLTQVVELDAGGLTVSLGVKNTGSEPWAFTAALHTYLRLDDVTRAELQGLQGLTYEDACQGHALAREHCAHLQITQEVDRVYLQSPAQLLLRRADRPTMQVLQSGFADTVVWNPGPAKAVALADLPDADWQHMLCIEAAQVAQPLVLAPGTLWQGQQRLALTEP